jgi:hypothetical protein
MPASTLGRCVWLAGAIGAPCTPLASGRAGGCATHGTTPARSATPESVTTVRASVWRRLRRSRSMGASFRSCTKAGYCDAWGPAAVRTMRTENRGWPESGLQQRGSTALVTLRWYGSATASVNGQAGFRRRPGPTRSGRRQVSRRSGPRPALDEPLPPRRRPGSVAVRSAVPRPPRRRPRGASPLGREPYGCPARS